MSQSSWSPDSASQRIEPQHAEPLSIGQVATLSGLSVRALRHYDEIGLLVPSARSAGGYRLYDEADIERLQRILFYRELGFPLHTIAELLTGPHRSPRAHMIRQRELIQARIERLEHLAAALSHELEALSMNYQLTPQERLEIWGEFNPEDYEDEAQQRWGDTDAWQQSARRTRSYTADDWRDIKADAARVAALMLEAMRAGHPATSPQAMDAAEAHRQHITRWFYDCSLDIHEGLAQMYICDPRFTKTYEDQAAGLAQYTHDAIVANTARHRA